MLEIGLILNYDYKFLCLSAPATDPDVVPAGVLKRTSIYYMGPSKATQNVPSSIQDPSCSTPLKPHNSQATLFKSQVALSAKKQVAWADEGKLRGSKSEFIPVFDPC